MSKIPPAPFWVHGESSEWGFWYNLVYKKLKSVGAHISEPPIYAPSGDPVWLLWLQNVTSAVGNLPLPPSQSEWGSDAWQFWYQELGEKVSAL